MPTIASEEFVRFGAALRRMTVDFAEQNRLLVLPNFPDKWQQFRATMARSADLFVQRNHLTRDDGLMLLLSVVYYYGRENGQSSEELLRRMDRVYRSGNIQLAPGGAGVGNPVEVANDTLEILVAIAGYYGDQMGRNVLQLLSLAKQSFGVWFEQEQRVPAPEAPPIQGLEIELPGGMAQPEVKVH